MIFKTGQHFLALNDTEVGIDIISLVSNQERERERERRRENACFQFSNLNFIPL